MVVNDKTPKSSFIASRKDRMQYAGLGSIGSLNSSSFSMSKKNKKTTKQQPANAINLDSARLSNLMPPLICTPGYTDSMISRPSYMNLDPRSFSIASSRVAPPAPVATPINTVLERISGISNSVDLSRMPEKPKIKVNSIEYNRLSQLKNSVMAASMSRGSIEPNALNMILEKESMNQSDLNQGKYSLADKKDIDSNAFLIEAANASALEPDEKLKFIFDLFDIHKKNEISKVEVLAFLQANYKSNELKLSGTTFNEVVDLMFAKIGNKETINFQQFNYLFGGSVDASNSKKVQSAEWILMDAENDQNRFLKYYEENKLEVLYITAYFLINIAAFLSKYYSFPFDPVAGHAARWAKGFAQIVLVNSLLILMPMTRGVISVLRQSPLLWKYIPFDANIEFHKMCGYVIIFASAGHTVAWLWIVYLARDSTDEKFSQSGFANLSQQLRKSTLWELGCEIPIWTGIVMISIAIIATPMTYVKVRRGSFNAFWLTHIMFVPFLILLTFHGAAAWVNTPSSFYWVAPPLILWIIERRHRLSGGVTRIVSVDVRPNMVAIYLEKPMKYDTLFKAGMYLHLKVPRISKWEWHPFTISSAPEDEYLSLHIRKAGDWTNTLHSLLKAAKDRAGNEIDGGGIPIYPMVLIDGPAGAPSQDYHHYKTLVLVGAGIGVTPFASILKSVLNMWEEHRCEQCQTVKFPRSFMVQKIYFYWVTREQDSLNWFKETMEMLSELDVDNRIEIHNYLSTVKRKSIVAPLEFMQTVMHKQGGQDIVSGMKMRNAKNLTHFGRPNWRGILDDIARNHHNENVGVFLCGPKVIDNTVKKVCNDYNTHQSFGVKYSYHAENF